MDRNKQKTKADLFRAMHRGRRILLLPNAWDAVSARVFEEAGFGAIATTSAGIAFTLGYPDGKRGMAIARKTPHRPRARLPRPAGWE